MSDEGGDWNLKEKAEEEKRIVFREMVIILK